MKKLSIILICILLLLTGCNQKENINPDFGGEISLFAYSPDTLNPLKTVYKTNASLLTALLYKTPVTLNEDYSVSPCLAESWSFSNDGKVCTLKIRNDILFSDGTPLAAEHIKNSLNEAKINENNLYHNISDYVESCETDKNNLKLNLKIPGNGVLNHLIFPVIKDNTSLLGCGLYILDEQSKNELTFTAVTADSAIYKANIEKVHVKLYPKTDMLANSFLTSETDVITADMATLSKLTTKTNISSKDYITDTFTYLGFNNQSTILPDENARKAVGYCINKKEMLDKLFVGYAINTNSPFKPGTKYSELHNGDFNFNTTLARKYLDSSAAEDLSFTILVNEESSTKKKVADYIAERLNESGMYVTVSALPFEDYLSNIESGNYTVYIGEINISSEQDFKFLLHSSMNNLFYSSSYMDSLLDKFSLETDESKKAVYAQQIQKQILDQAPIISLYYKTNVFMVNDKIKGDFNPLPNNIYNGIEKWTVK